MNVNKNDAFYSFINDESGKVYADWEDNGFRVLVMRGPGSINGYVGVPKNHSAWGKDYNSVNIDCHGGLTFSQEGSRDRVNGLWSEGWWWFGWDYAHYGDACLFDIPSLTNDEHLWTPGEVEHDAKSVLKQFKEMK